ncbi:hypothetical protein GCM10011506_05450 [Marivirga lumbricoides]|uniref:Cardiolipin synthase n=1 Tax=Marivirga lumbricoides TaxID=1046115 RepID=A0ABQ1LER1_9BACT|nr:hypothetical protein GCM10011506_05450 [Marivirga lumbricoides]
MKIKKIAVLLIVLSLPVILYLFLTYFGNNEFDLPVYFADGNDHCAEFKRLEEVSEPFTWHGNSAVLSEILEGNINMVNFPNPEADNQQLINELNRLVATLSDEGSVKVHSFYLSGSVLSDQQLLESEAAQTYEIDTVLYKSFADCYFALPTAIWEGRHPSEMELRREQVLVLVDENLDIRGYYDGLETKDVDRLILEIRILLSNRPNEN